MSPAVPLGGDDGGGIEVEPETRAMLLSSHVEVPAKDLEYMNPISHGEIRHWFAAYWNLEEWLPANMLPSQRDQVIALMHWCDVTWTGADDVVLELLTALETQPRPCMLWIWQNSEHLSSDTLLRRVIWGAALFDDNIGAQVYSPAAKIRYARTVINDMEHIILRDELPIAELKAQHTMRAMASGDMAAGFEDARLPDEDEVPTYDDALSDDKDDARVPDEGHPLD